MAHASARYSARGASGEISLTMFDANAKVKLVDPEHSNLEPIQIRWVTNDYEATVMAFLTAEEAWNLAMDLLAAASTISEPIDNDVDDTATVNDDGANAAPREVA
ncbi:hypothetical protein [Nocardia arthritidis]|uniref:Uncharacterized protein n=1 Tax=Nocardia arthritidis TaxID=228602 RepID=A0A6G9YBU2_9NOCA|nr:hypothetical protein [Nocardia arthritidis]QIS10745.1 hypothetical protein F5544_14290 [Nocardia arthritidis]